MDELRLDICHIEPDYQLDFLSEYVVVYINGRDLRDILRDVEYPYGLKEGRPERAGMYLGLDTKAVSYPSRYLLDRPEDWVHDRPDGVIDGRVVIQRCGCTCYGCNDITMRITLTDDEVIWDDFYNYWKTEKWVKEPWDYSSLKFVFNRKQYERELSRFSVSAKNKQIK